MDGRRLTIHILIYKDKMKITKLTCAIVAVAAICSLAANAKNQPKTAYIFGLATSFNDSTVYITSVQQVDSAYLDSKTKFLASRENYSYQLRDYLEQQGAGNRTCIVMFDINQKKAEKKWSKIYDRYTKRAKAKKAKNGQSINEAPVPYQVKMIANGDFTFQAIEPNEDFEEVVKKAPKEKGKRPRPDGPQPGGQPGAGGPGGMPGGGPRPQ